MKLLMISTDRKIFEEGSAVRVRQIEYAKEYEEVHIIVFAKKSKVQSLKSETVIASNCWAYSTNSPSKFFYSFNATSLGRFIISKRGITSITCQDPFLTAMSGVALKREFSLPLEIQLHTDIGSPNFGYTTSNKIRKILALSYLLKADTIRVVSNKIKDYLTSSLGIDAAKITVRPIAVDIEKIKNAQIIEGADLRKKYSRFEKIVLMASRLEKEKNVGLAIRAWAGVIETMPKAGLVIVGSGSEDGRLKKMVAKLNLANSIAFEDWTDRDRLISYYKTADIFLNTSLFEGYGMTLIEAQAAGCKMVSTDVGVAREVGAAIIPWYDSNRASEIIALHLSS
ncbi:MAG: hypothetical protein A3C79_01950 [Candidatus Taylorbacteria bacterium RIFCSPHIGHO2_02_FULL_45_28]|uniref:Glycosyl transferase family 1 domain-containing protein n=1 Tax=Candidatus Taylorbacteria bacterium RIFCSPHIGHO2_12_FULL_45_16 TaxID=1802315 RepID=A0A1G2MZZ1_9BACT|nr:MAG: hypothetical protein A2830_02755 [Candidatus Taylorbacteria bacterium RIFCSPHIGHO2_01_FULL_44_110]OHA25213.1 MAG: hypothetical protein A3C79_01950 [Candidatus Taylorbacteria bacterium RIFCSPHIGHO2_02_FULL_45_28]OHA29457.1 MAG: hypothetical protein A3F51_00260 [Candidatus Taylorbacteria bacterium RIFCSPHIGHO2_12_FULL_45_16]OHA33219.1 MAG: hypothetical protein A3A23_02790 [Candidatus Taylorbacteria bacterium RIFCSPLOWO2_01_FULL_45_59]OHA38270.1 MAG: hypothetical protein A3I98_03055 [Candi